MQIVDTAIIIAASPHTVWAVLDDLPAYPVWNPVIPRLVGLTTVGSIVEGELVIPGLPAPPLTPTITRIVAARELRWLTVIPGDEGFSAEHIFELDPVDGGTHLVHREIFDGPAAIMMADALQALVRPAYESFNRALKARAEALAQAAPLLHPAVDAAPLAAGVDPYVLLQCQCVTHPVTAQISAPIAHNHLCGCSRCWKPDGALFAQTAVVAADAAEVIANADKLAPIDASSAIVRAACVDCGVHMIGTVHDRDHHFYGLAFIHPELATKAAVGRPDFAGFCSSLIEQGQSAASMHGIRATLEERGIPAYDGFSPEIMDVIAYHQFKLGSR